MGIKKIFQNAVACLCHGVDRLMYEYFSYQYIKITKDAELLKDESVENIYTNPLTEEGVCLAANRVLDRMIDRATNFPFLRMPDRKNAVVPMVK